LGRLFRGQRHRREYRERDDGHAAPRGGGYPLPRSRRVRSGLHAMIPSMEPRLRSSAAYPVGSTGTCPAARGRATRVPARGMKPILMVAPAALVAGMTFVALEPVALIAWLALIAQLPRSLPGGRCRGIPPWRGASGGFFTGGACGVFT